MGIVTLMQIIQNSDIKSILYSGKVWRIDSFRALAKKVWQINRSANRLSCYLKVLIWMVLVWRIMDDLPNFPPPNFPAIRYYINFRLKSIMLLNLPIILS